MRELNILRKVFWGAVCAKPVQLYNEQTAGLEAKKKSKRHGE